MRDSRLNAKADEIHRYADSHDMKNVYNRLKEVYGPTPSGSFLLLSADGLTLITEKEKILDRWAEHFNGVLNRSSTINEEAINPLPYVPINQSLDAVPTLEEIQNLKQPVCCQLAKHLVKTQSQLKFTKKGARL